ncbi:MAG: hypothetical protein D1H97_11220 [Paracoccus sp. BP8]|nr:MAG: hypothetical protein D1H97_11220 [Paracoccus sp. BP8]
MLPGGLQSHAFDWRDICGGVQSGRIGPDRPLHRYSARMKSGNSTTPAPSAYAPADRHHWR